MTKENRFIGHANDFEIVGHEELTEEEKKIGEAMAELDDEVERDCENSSEKE